MDALEVFFTILGMAAVTLLCRSFFLLPERELPLPGWLRNGLRYAPLAALAAVVAPEVVLTNGRLIQTWQDARLFGTAVGMGLYVWRQDLLLTIIGGTATMLALRFGLGW